MKQRDGQIERPNIFKVAFVCQLSSWEKKEGRRERERIDSQAGRRREKQKNKFDISKLN